jgi:hypothetical protein
MCTCLDCCGKGAGQARNDQFCEQEDVCGGAIHKARDVFEFIVFQGFVEANMPINKKIIIPSTTSDL